jgi:hypothetical protein
MSLMSLHNCVLKPWSVSCLVALLGLLAPAAVSAGDELAPASERFRTAETTETPDFQKHLSPMLGKLGCNGRACHGSFQGRGGFQLSLFGYDFKLDHKNLLERVDLEDPAESYVLHKPLMIIPHEGGQRLELGSWEYNLFLNWLKGGAQPLAGDPVKLEKLEITPAEIQFRAAGETQQLRAVAVWADGTREDVTCLCRFQTNDDAICDVTAAGLVTAAGPGDSHVIVFYDNAVVPVPVLQPIGSQFGPDYPALAASTKIDALVLEKLAKLGVLPSEVCDDAEFLRRVHLDLTATLPTAAQVVAFLNDSSPDKRARKVEELLQTPAYAAWWTTRLCDWTGCSDQQLNNVNPVNRQNGSVDWYQWIYKRVAENVPYDELMEHIVVAEGRRPGESYLEYSERMSNYYRSDEASFADQEGLIYFWGRANFRTNEDRAIGFAYTFMGTRIQCAQCHKHPFDVWTQDDFQQFEQFFTRVRFNRNGEQKAYNQLLNELGIDPRKVNGNDLRAALQKAVKDGKTIPFPDLVVVRDDSRARRAKDDPKAAFAKLLGEQEVNLANIEDPRTALMDWLRNSPTQLFAKAFVNRVWANYFNRGIVEPTDDLSLANPPSNAPLLDYLAQGFIDSGYNMHWLHREIILSDTYQRSWKPNETNLLDERNFSRAVVRRLPAEVAYDALTMATLSESRAAEFASLTKGRAIHETSPPRNGTQGKNYALAVFGRSVRESNCDCDRSTDASLLQTLYTRNDRDVEQMLTSNNGWLKELSRSLSPQSDDLERKLKQAAAAVERFTNTLETAKTKGTPRLIERAEQELAKAQATLTALQEEAATPREEFAAEELVQQAYLRTLSRYPTDGERSSALAYLAARKTPERGLHDLLWALLNTKEFMLNH